MISGVCRNIMIAILWERPLSSFIVGIGLTLAARKYFERWRTPGDSLMSIRKFWLSTLIIGPGGRGIYSSPLLSLEGVRKMLTIGVIAVSNFGRRLR